MSATAAAPDASVLQARNVGVRLGGRDVLAGVDLDVHQGEVVAVVGPNGAGKSTLLSVLAGDLAPRTGRVLLDGAPLAGVRPRDLARRRSVLPQQHTYAFPFTVGEILAMGRAPWHGITSKADDHAAIARAVARTEIGPLLHRPVDELSGGERARVALARVLAQSTAIVLLDEPTAALDIRHQELVLQVAAEDAANGSAVVVVLHDLTLAAAHADRVALVAAGQLMHVGAPRDVLRAGTLSEIYEAGLEVWPHPRTGDPVVLPRRE